jgi:phosphomannomutase
MLLSVLLKFYITKKYPENMDKTTMGSIFRAYDIRGVYGVNLTEEIVSDIGAAFSTFIGYGKKICLSRDTRNSGASLLESFASGLKESGCNVVKVGIVPIPVLGFLTWHRNFDAGIYMSASHNPPEYNGVRIRGANGAGFLDEEKKVKDIFMKKKFRRISSEQKEKISETNYDAELLLEEYFDFITKKISLERELSLIVDPGNGSSYQMLPLYEELGCKVHGINTNPDGNFPGRGPNPNEKTLKHTSEFLKSVGGDFGVAFDADADRGIILDDTGMFVPPEKIAVLIAKHSGKSGKVVASTDSSILLEKELAGSGIKVIREKVGDVFMAKAVEKHNAIIGVERSGHFFIPEFHASDDPFVMSAKLAEILSKTNKSLSDIVKQIPEYPYSSESLNCPDEVKFDVMEILKDTFLELKNAYNVDLMDGIRISTDEWMVLIRASNTEPIIRMYVETSVDNLEELKNNYREILQKTIKHHSK